MRRDFTTDEHGQRNVAEEAYGRVKIRVVAGYDIRSDGYIAHTYVTPDGQPERKLHAYSGDGFKTLEEAFDAAFGGAKPAIDAGAY